MTLEDWLQKQKLSPNQFCDRYKFSATSLYRYLRATGDLSLENKLRLESITKSEVTVEEIRKLKKRSELMGATRGRYTLEHERGSNRVKGK